MSLEIILPLAAAIILLVLLVWIIRVFQVTFKTIVILLIILLLLQFLFGIKLQDIMQEMLAIVERIVELITDN
ncbi:MAG: hypothetical protein AAFQ80_14020 [Cyanobacteria bacterium J06621_8]